MQTKRAVAKRRSKGKSASRPSRQGGSVRFPPRLPAGGAGLAVRLTIAIGAGKAWRLTERRVAGASPRQLAGRMPAGRLAAVLAAAGSEHRLKLLMRLLAGPAAYRELRDLSGLLAGPLYHHLNTLRLALLIQPKRRDTYQLTPAGRTLVLGLAALAPLMLAARR